MSKPSVLETLLKDKTKTQGIIDLLYKQATEAEVILLRSIGKNPLRLMQFYPKQQLFLKDPTQIRLCTGGNSSGKTMIGCAEFITKKKNQNKKKTF